MSRIVDPLTRAIFDSDLIAIDQLANAVIGGWADETLSSRAWRENRTHLVAHNFKELNK